MTAPSTREAALPDMRRERLEGWGMSQAGESRVARPESVDELRTLFERARTEGWKLGLRGSGCSYGDASLNSEGPVVDVSRLKQVIAFDESAGRLTVEPGFTIQDTWRLGLPKGWWPPVVPGTMFPTLAGCAGMNIHGKNNFQAGTIGEHIEAFDLLLADGSVRTCTRDQNAELFHAAIGGFGMLGAFTAITLKLKRVHSGRLRVRPLAARSFREMIALLEEHHESSDYLVGWVDAYGRGEELGRGLIHQAWYLKEGEDQDAAASFLEENQVLPPRFFGVVPKSWMWTGLWCFLNRPGMKLVNAAKYHMGRRHAHKEPYLQSLVGFSFLLDYVPNWKFAYKPGGLIQYQSFVPKAEAGRVYETLVKTAQERGIMPYLGVLKKHKPDPFLMTHAVDGYSLALDFPVTRGNRERVWKLAADLDHVVTDAGGRFYFAKDSTMTPATLRRAYPADALERFAALKRELDPTEMLQTDLWRRVVGPALSSD